MTRLCSRARAVCILACLPAGTGLAQTGNSEKLLPAWLKGDLTLRGRLDRDSGFKTTKGVDDTTYLHRIRIGMTAVPRPWLRFYVQAQDTEVAGYSRGAAPVSMSNPFDLYQGYLEIGNGDKGSWDVKLGRQELRFGDARLIGTSSWSNSGRSFDAAQLQYRRAGMKLNWFASALVVQLQPRFDRPQLRNGFYGFYSSFDRLKRKTVLEPYALWTIQSGTGESRHTWGARAQGLAAGGATYNVEMALQTGTFGRERIRAWAGHWNLRIPLPARAWSPGWTLEFNHASGDGDPGNGVQTTFDTLYNSNHDKYGLMDRFTWRNLNDALTGIECQPWSKWRVKTVVHYFWLANKNDAIYSRSGVVARARNATSGRLGPEFDVLATRALNGRLELSVGYSHLWAGPYVVAATWYRGSSYPFVMWEYRL